MIPLVCQLNGGPIRSSEVCVFEAGHQLRFHGFWNSLEEAVEEVCVRDGAGSVAPSADPNVARACSLEVTECSLHRGVASLSVEPRLELPIVLGGRENVAADFVHGALVAVGSSVSEMAVWSSCVAARAQMSRNNVIGRREVHTREEMPSTQLSNSPSSRGSNLSIPLNSAIIADRERCWSTPSSQEGRGPNRGFLAAIHRMSLQ